ncbi:MAG: hypothetical protein JKY74_09310 [Shewanella sp.]|nr:hypothetical protein [Shewanella sp.]
MKLFNFLILTILVLLSGCNSANHGSFVTQTFDGAEANRGAGVALVKLGKVEGKSCQTAILYLIPFDESASTHRAIEDAKSKIEGTALLADISIDDKLWVEFGYSVQCILVSATAYGVKTGSQ